MRYGFVKASAITPKIRVADCMYNAEQIIAALRKAADENIEIACFPELCITGYTCGDLFLQPVLQKGARAGLQKILDETAELAVVSVIGLPVVYEGKLYNCAAVCQYGSILGIIPKTHLPNHGDSDEMRWFTPAPAESSVIEICGDWVPFGSSLLFRCKDHPELTFGVEIGEDLLAPLDPGVQHALDGACVLCCPCAASRTIGRTDFARTLVSGQSARLLCSFICSFAGEGESTTDLVFGGNNLITENGCVLAESAVSSEGKAVTDIDTERLYSERIRTSFFPAESKDVHTIIEFSLPESGAPLTRKIPVSPFISEDESVCRKQCAEILAIQAAGLKKRMEHVHAKTAVLGISGGLDSTLALLVTVKTFRLLGRPLKDIVAVTMPCFGTTARTKSNAERLCEALGVTLQQINVTDTVRSNFSDIGQSEDVHDVTFENTQARVRTLVLMNLANRLGGLVIGTGDLSELALGWATYNGDHMSMYGVNASVPKTMLRHIVAYAAEDSGSKELYQVLHDILDTPVSPELLPAENGEISQQTEEIVGPYALHDFFLYYAVRCGFSPAKIYYLAQQAFKGEYTNAVLIKWIRNFYRRFFTQQFKRSCLPDGPKVGEISFSPRGDWNMPSDACAALWMAEADALEE